MKKYNIVIVSEDTAEVSKSFYKKAMVYGTPEYKFLKKFKSENPEIKYIELHEIKRNSEIENNRNLSYEAMESYIRLHANSEALLAEFGRQKQLAIIAKSPYFYVLNWFKSVCFSSEEEFKEFRLAQKSIQTAETVISNA